jgi:hypothetical protein
MFSFAEINFGSLLLCALCLFKENFHNPRIIAALVALRNVKNLILPDFEYVISFMSDVEVSK